MEHSSKIGSVPGEPSSPRVMIFAPYYLPFVKGGGPIVSIANITKQLQERFDFWIVTGDRDLGDRSPRPDVIRHRWDGTAGVKVLRCVPRKYDIRQIRRLIAKVDPDVVYLNSVFNLRYSIFPLVALKSLLGRSRKVVLAPRGEFYPGAMVAGNAKKRLFLKAAKICALHRDVIWQATSKAEAHQIESLANPRSEVVTVPNLSPPVESLTPSPPKRPGSLRAIFISRIVEKKGLYRAISCLRHVTGSVCLDVYGPIEDVSYWESCRRLLSELPASIRVQHHGVVEHHRVQEVLAQSDLLIFPSFGENYGHVVAEALSTGVPVLTTIETPWTDLEVNQAGRALELDDEAFRRAVQEFVDFDDQDYQEYVKGAWEYASHKLGRPSIAALYNSVFGDGATDCGQDGGGDDEDPVRS